MAGKKKNNTKNKSKQSQPKPAAAAGTEAGASEAAAAPAPAIVAAVNETRDGAPTPDVPGGPGGFPETPASELDDKVISINPLPATEGLGNPIKLAPGEKVPESITTQDINKNVKLDKESYEKSDAMPGVVGGAAAAGTGVAASRIPESGGLAMGGTTNVNDPTISSAAAGSTTAALAGQVPKESTKVPEVVKESQDKANVSPEASAVPSEVREKNRVEQELKDKVPKAPATTEGTAGVGVERKENTGAIAGAAAATGGAAIAAGTVAVSKFSDNANPAAQDAKKSALDTANNNLPAAVKDKLPESAQNALSPADKTAQLDKVSPEVPKQVKESLAEANKAPEAAASTAAVEDKKKVESELIRDVKTAPAIDDTHKTESKAATANKTTDATKTTESKADDKTGTGSKVEDAKKAAASKVDDAKKAVDSKTGSDAKANGEAKDGKKKGGLSRLLSKIKSKLQ